MKVKAAVLAGAPHLMPAFELFHHAVLPAAKGTRHAFRAREAGDSAALTALRALRAAAFPVALGVAFLGLHQLLGRLAPDIQLFNRWVNGDDLAHVAGGALLGFTSGVLEALKPELFGHGHSHPHEGHSHHHHHDEGSHVHGSEKRAAESNRVHILRAGLRHAAFHALLDAALIAAGKGIVAAAGGDPRHLQHRHGLLFRREHHPHGA